MAMLVPGDRSRVMSLRNRINRACFSANVSPGQEEQPMFWFKDKYQSFSAQSIVEAVTALDSDNLL